MDTRRECVIYTAAATRRAKSVVIYIGCAPRFCYLHSGSDASHEAKKSVAIYNRSAMGICYLHNGSDTTDKKCCNLHGIRDVVRQIPYLEAILRIYKSVIHIITAAR